MTLDDFVSLSVLIKRKFIKRFKNVFLGLTQGFLFCLHEQLSVIVNYLFSVDDNCNVSSVLMLPMINFFVSYREHNLLKVWL